MKVMVLPLIIVIVFSACSKTPQPEAQATPMPQPTAAELLANIEKQRSAGHPDLALKSARELIAVHKGSPEAEVASKAIPELESAVRIAEKEAQARAAKAEATAEAKQLAAKWRYRKDEDPMTSRTLRQASNQSENSVSFAFPYQGEQHGTLTLRDHPTYGRDVIFSIEKGQILCQSYQDCQIRVRFDEASPERWSAVGPADHSNTAIFLRNGARFVQRLRKSKVIRLQIPIYQQGEPLLEFVVGGFDWSRYQAK